MQDMVKELKTLIGSMGNKEIRAESSSSGKESIAEKRE